MTARTHAMTAPCRCTDGIDAARGVVLGVLLSLPLWALIAWVVREVLS